MEMEVIIKVLTILVLALTIVKIVKELKSKH